MTEGTVAPATVTFTSGTWNIPQTVTMTGVDDALVDGNISYTIVTTADTTTSDANYNGLNPDDVSVTNIDNDTAGITVNPTSGLTTTEAGGTDTFTVVLNTQPTANVTIGLSSSDATEGTVAPATVTFTSGTWNTPQTVTVTGVDDALVDGNISYTIVTAADTTTSDANYNGLNPDDVSVTNTDDDTAGITITPTSGLTTTEAGGTATFTIVLNTQPTANVTIGLSSTDTTEGTVTPATVTFTIGTWNTPQTVTVTGVDDALVDGNISYTIVTAADTTTSDANYNGLNPDDVSVTNTDNDTAAFNVSINVTPGTTTTVWTLLTFTPVPSGGTMASVTWKFGDCATAPTCGTNGVQSESTITSPPFTETFQYPEPGTYTVTLEATDTLSNTATDSVTITVTGPGSSLTADTFGLGDNLTAGSPVAGDIDGDGDKDVIVSSGNHVLVYYTGGGSLSLGPAAGNFGSSPLLAEVNNTGAIDDIFALDTTGRLYGWATNGASLPGYPLAAAGITNVSLMASPAIGDIDGDGDLDIAWGGDNTGGSAYATAHDLATGAVLTGFPVLVSNSVGTGPSYPRTTSVTLANVIGSVGKEIFIGYNNVATATGGVLRVTSGGATLNFSMNPGEQIGSGGTPSAQYANSGPTIGDTNNDGTMELILGGDQGNVYIWNAATGALETIVNTGSAAITSDPALAYLTSNTGLDIVVANSTGTVFCVRNGSVVWQTDLGTNGLLSPAIADVDGDNSLEVIISRMRSGRVFVLESNGTVNAALSSTTGTAGQINASAAVVDLDRDADYEIIVTDDVASPAQDKLYIWDIPKTLPTASLRTIIGWPFLRGNHYRDGAITTSNLYPVNVTYDASAWPLVKFWIHVENRGTGIANNVALKYVSNQPFMSLVSPANGIVMITPNPPASIAPGATGVTEPFTFNMSGYAGQEIIMYFDITYTDANGTEYLIHR